MVEINSFHTNYLWKRHSRIAQVLGTRSVYTVGQEWLKMIVSHTLYMNQHYFVSVILMQFVLLCKKWVLKRWSVCLHASLILGCHTYVHFQVPNNLLNDVIPEKVGCSHELQTIYGTSSYILNRFLKVTFAIKFALMWRAAPRCGGESPGRGTRYFMLSTVMARGHWQWLCYRI